MSNPAQNPAVEALMRERDNAVADIERLQADIKIARHKLRSFEDAISLLTGAPASKVDGSPTLKDLVMDQLTSIPGGRTPLEIALALTNAGRDTSNTSVSPILSRLLKDGAVEKIGDRWHAVKTKTAPGAPTQEAVEESGPVGRERGYPPSAPEGSTPSGSTVIRDLKAELANVRSTLPLRPQDLDDEIPF